MDGFEHFDQATLPCEDAQDRRSAVRLAIIDERRLRRDCLKLALAQQFGRWEFRDAASPAEIFEAAEDFDVVLLVASRSAQIEIEDVAALAELAPVLVCADYDDLARARRILRAGARGLVPAHLGLGALLAAIERVRGGGAYLPAMLREMRPERPPAADAGDAVWRELTRRQRDVLALITEGKSNKLIAGALTMSEDTVKAHVKQIIRRLNVANRTQAALLAAGTGRAAGRWEVARR